MRNEEFRAHGYAVIDWIADYMRRVDELPVAPSTQPGDVRRALPLSPPDEPESISQCLRDMNSIIVPALMHWQSPRFFGYFPANVDPAALLGDFLSSGLGVQGMLWSTSPACTELETHMMDWLAQLLDLPMCFRSPEGGGTAGGGVIQDTASSATLCAAVAARERARARARDEVGNASSDPLSRLVAYSSTQAHSSIEKALRIIGIAPDRLRTIGVDAQWAMRPDELRVAIERDRRSALIPFFCVAAVGTTSTLAVDPVSEIAELCGAHGIWLHVDGAMAGVAALCPEFREMHRSLDRADSYCVNPHKWMGAGFDCDALYVADRSALVSALSILPEYLRNAATESGKVIDYRDWQIPLGRRFRALKLWFLIRATGARALREMIRTHVELARTLADRLRNDVRFEVIEPQNLALVCFRLKSGESATESLVTRINASGEAFMTHTRLELPGHATAQYIARVSIGQRTTTAVHVDALWSLIDALA